MVHKQRPSVRLCQTISLSKFDAQTDFDEFLNLWVEGGSSTKQELEVASSCCRRHFPEDQGVQEGCGESLGRPFLLVGHTPFKKGLESDPCQDEVGCYQNLAQQIFPMISRLFQKFVAIISPLLQVLPLDCSLACAFETSRQKSPALLCCAEEEQSRGFLEGTFKPLLLLYCTTAIKQQDHK